MQQLLPQYASLVTPGVWALIGAAATLAGVTRTTGEPKLVSPERIVTYINRPFVHPSVSLVVIILELTGDMAYTVPTAIAVLIAKAVADAIEDEGIYDLVIRMNQFPYLNAKKQHIFGNYRVADMVSARTPG
jgi:chloride channel 3/4/5